MAVDQSSALSLTITRLVAAKPERVFAAWTTAEALKRWSAPSDAMTAVAEVDLRVGGRYRIHMSSPDGREYLVTGVYREIVPPRRLVYTWFWETDSSLGEMLITVEFHARGDATEIVLVHSQLPTEQALTAHRNGWTGCLVRLEQLLAGGQS